MIIVNIFTINPINWIEIIVDSVFLLLREVQSKQEFFFLTSEA